MPADKEEIRDRTDIVELIGTFVPLRQRGRNWLGLCPFHQEKTPSFNVTPLTRTFKCFGCGASGDAYSFVERYNNMSFVEAAEFLARRLGLTFDRKGAAEEAGKASERDQIFAVNSAALAWFRRMLEKVQIARDYVYSRGLVHDTIQRFQLGYAPEGWDNLTRYLQGQRFDLRVAQAAGLVHAGKSGDYYDVFRHRVIFPIHDEQERVVGFGGRAFGDDQPKYLNTGETPVFVKSRLLYGLPFARRKIASEDRTLLMEGYMDVIAAHQAGFTNAVATLGTSLTEDHGKKLAQLASKVVLVYDADNAGIKATLRAAEIFKQLQERGIREVDLRMVRLPEGDDPDSVLKRGSVAEFQRAVDEAADYVEYLIDAARQRQDLSNEEGRAKFLSDLGRILVDVPRIELCDLYLTRYAELHPLSKISLQSAVDQMRRDLVERRNKLRRRQRPRQAGDSTQATASSGALGNGSASPAKAGDQSPKEAAKADMPYRPRRQWTREEREQYDRQQYRKSVRPVEGGAIRSADELAEDELIRALLEPDWRTAVLKSIDPDELPSVAARSLFALVAGNLSLLQEDENRLGQLLAGDGAEIAAARDRLQEIQGRMANEPITNDLVAQCAATLRRRRKERHIERLGQELAQLLQKTPLSEADSVQAREFQRLIEELKGSTDGQ